MANNNVIEIVLRAVDNATGELETVRTELKKLDQSFAETDKAAAALGGSLKYKLAGVAAGIVVGGLVAAGAALNKIIRTTAEAEATNAKLDAAYRATGATLRITRSGLDDLAKSMQSTTTYSSGLVKEAEAVLLTFTKVRGEGFERTIKVAGDLAARLGIDLVSATNMVGRALENPERALNSLRGAGIVFTDQERKLIKALSDAGAEAQAQEVILRKLEKTYGGTANALRNTLGGALQGLKNQFNELFEGKNGLPRAANAINNLAKALDDPKIKQGFENLVVVGIAALDKLITKADQLARMLANLFDIEFPVTSIEDAVNSIDSQLGTLEKRRGQLLDSATVAFDERAKAELAEIEVKIAQLELRKAALETVGQGPGPRSRPRGRGDAPVEVPRILGLDDYWGELEEVRVKSKRILDGMTEQSREWLENTETTAQRAARAWRDFVTDLQMSFERGDIDAKEFNKRMEDYFNRELPEVEIGAKKLVLPEQELSAAGKRAAENIQDAFANAFINIDEGWKGLARNLLRVMQQTVANLAAASLVKALKIEELIKKVEAPSRKQAKAEAEAVFAKISVGGPGQGGKPFTPAEAQARAREMVEKFKQDAANTAQVVAAVEKQTLDLTTAMAANDPCACVDRLAGAVNTSGVVDAVDNTTGTLRDTAKSTQAAVGRVVTTASGNVVRSVEMGSANVVDAIFKTANKGGGGFDLGDAIKVAATVYGGKMAGGGTVPRFAGGGLTPTIVGEEGPELAFFPAGTKIMNQRQAAYARGGGGNVTFAPQYNIRIEGVRDAEEVEARMASFVVRQDAKTKGEIMAMLRDNGFGRMR